MTTLLTQLFLLYIIYLSEPSITLFPVEEVLLRAEKFDAGREPYVRIGAQMVYINSGISGQNAVVKKEVAIMHLGPEVTYFQEWRLFATYVNNENKLVAIEKSPVQPFSVTGGNVVSHDTNFSPIPKKCGPDENSSCKWDNYLIWDDFLTRIKRVDTVKFEFVGEVYGQKPRRVKCTVEVDMNMLDRLEELGWYTAPCI